MSKKKIFNQAQVKATVNIFLEIIKGILLIIILGRLFPNISGKVTPVALFFGLLCVAILYSFVIILLKGVKDYDP